VSDGYKDLFAWLAKQDSSKPHIRQIIDLISASVVEAEKARLLESELDRRVAVGVYLAKKNEALEAEVERLKKKYESLPSILE